MTFLSPVSYVVATQMYWISQILFGYLVILTAYRLAKRPLPKFWTDAPLFAKFILSFAAISFVFSAWSILGYLLHLPAWWLAASYVFTGSSLLIYALFFLRSQIRQDIRHLFEGLRSLRLFSMSTALLVLVAVDLVINLRFGGYLSGDAMVHMAKIHGLVDSGFSLTDPGFGTAVQSSYMVTAWHSMLAIPVYFGVNVINAWIYSLAIAKLAILAALFYLGWHILGNVGMKGKSRTLASGFLLALLVITPSKINMSIALYPNTLVIAWIALLMVGLLLLLGQKKSGGAVLTLVAGVLLATTHPLYSLMALLLVLAVGLFVLLFSRRKESRRAIVILLTTCLILVIAPLLEWWVLRDSKKSLDVSLQNASYPYWHLFGMKAFSLNFNKFASQGLASAAWVAVGFLGYAYILYRASNKYLRILVTSALLLVLLATAFPPTFQVMQSVLPVWAIQRFYDVNVLAYLSVGLGLVALVTLAVRRLPKVRALEPLIYIGLIGVLALSFGAFSMSWRSYRPDDAGVMQYKKTQQYLHDLLMRQQALVSSVPPKSTVLAPTYESFRLQAVAPVHVLTIPPDNTNALIDINKRMECQRTIFYRLSGPTTEGLSLMKEAGVKYVIAWYGSDEEKALKKHPAYSQIVKTDDQEALYKINYGKIQPARDSVCSFNE